MTCSSSGYKLCILSQKTHQRAHCVKKNPLKRHKMCQGTQGNIANEGQGHSQITTHYKGPFMVILILQNQIRKALSGQKSSWTCSLINFFGHNSKYQGQVSWSECHIQYVCTYGCTIALYVQTFEYHIRAFNRIVCWHTVGRLFFFILPFCNPKHTLSL